MRTDSARAEVVGTIVCVIRTSYTVREVWMYTGAHSATNVSRALASVIGTKRTDHLVVRQTRARPITAIRVGAVIVGLIPARHTGR